VLYALPTADFHDVISGNNDGEIAAVGYDAASGLGSLRIARVLTDAHAPGNQLPVAGFSVTYSGQSVNFTDNSTDDGGIASHAWNFGDGATSTAANPSHTYAAAGVYSVSEKVKDTLGASATSIQTVAPGTIQLLGNPGFETGTAPPWKMSQSMLDNYAPEVHTGNWAVLIGYVSGGTDELNQIVTIPTGKASATLAFYLANNDDQHVAGPGYSDDMYVNVYDPKSQVLLGTVARITKGDLFPFGSWLLRSYDMTPYMGRKVNLKFIRHRNPISKGGAWALDDITLTVQ
jgi:hypothetical protein